MRFLIILSLIISSNLYAMSCPSTGSVLQEGYSIAEVIAHCGQPLSRNDAKMNTNLNEDWVYYQPDHADNTKITFSFNSGRLVNINILDTSHAPTKTYERNVTTTGFCRQIVQVGSNMNYVRSVCGNPAKQNVTSSTSTDVTELVYNGTKPNILVFNNGKLADWKY